MFIVFSSTIQIHESRSVMARGRQRCIMCSWCKLLYHC